MGTGLLCVLIGCAAFGQAAKDPTFEVATIKPFTPPQAGGFIRLGKTGGPGTADPGQITWLAVTVRQLLTTAYDVKSYQVTGPKWLDSEIFSIVAKVSRGTTTEQVKVMWQNLLTERFGVVLHRESKEFQVDELVVARGGSKLKETTLDPNAPPYAPEGRGPVKTDRNGFPEFENPGTVTLISGGLNGLNAHAGVKGQGLAQLVDMLSSERNRPVIDKTGLTGKYDFKLEYTPIIAPLGAPPGAGGGPVDNAGVPGMTLSAAVQEQLGLRLVQGKAMLDVLVIDQANKEPTEN